MAHRRSRISSTRSARLTRWVGPTNQGYIAVAGAGATFVSQFAIESPVTVMRTRGQVSIIPAAFTADVDIIGAVGMGIVSAEAAAAGVASMPEPFGDADWGGWFVWRSFSYSFQHASDVGVNFPNWNFEVDSKAMRKASINEVLVVIAESQSGAFEISTPLRVLLKLS